MSNVGESAIDRLAGQWRLLEIASFTEGDGRRPHKVKFIVHPEGVEFDDPFFTSDRALSRLICMLSRAGYPEEEIKKRQWWGDEMIRLRVWARLTVEEYNGRRELRTDGWNFASTEEPPEEAAGDNAIDYSARDAEERAMEGL